MSSCSPHAKHRRSSIRVQVLAIAVIPALVITFLLVFVVYRGTVLRGDQALAQQGRLLAAQLASTLEYAVSTGAESQIPVTIDATVKPAAEVLQTEVKHVAVFDETDRLLYATPAIQGSATAELDALFGQTVAGGEFRTFTAPIHLDPLGLSTELSRAGRYLGKVKIDISTTPIKAAYFQHFLVDMGLILFTFSAVLLLAHVTGRRLSGAIREAAQAIQRIKAGDLSVRLQKTESSEIGTLQEGVNLAVEAIVQGKEELERALAHVRSEHEIALSELRVQTEAAEKANQAKSMFLAKVSHEMRTPLYSIQGLTEQLLRTPRQGDDARSLRNILKASKTLYHTISDILDFTQLESGKYQPLLKPFDLWGEIEINADTIGLLVQEQGLYLDVIVGHDVPPTMIGDQRGFRTIVANLIANAVKFTQHGGICIRLECESQQTDRMAMISLQVQDTGCGISQERLATIFEPFEQIDGGLNRRYDGSGLGLSIVKNYCDAMSGSITVASEPGKGSNFTVRLPLEICPTSVSASGNTGAFSGLCALVVDERPSFCESIENRLSSLGVSIVQRLCPVQELLALTPPSQRFHLIAFRDLSDVGLSVGKMRWLHTWSRHIVSFETRNDSEQFRKLLDIGISAVLRSGATRGAIAAALNTMNLERSEKIPDFDSDSPDLNECPNGRDDLKGKQVLVVEDYEINREVMSRQLRNHGLRTIEAGDGDEAVALASQPGIDLILMDIQMPVKDGITAIKEIRETPSCTTIPILGFTASADKPTNRRVIEAGADKVLTKPISEEELITAVHRTLVTP